MNRRMDEAQLDATMTRDAHPPTHEEMMSVPSNLTEAMTEIAQVYAEHELVSEEDNCCSCGERRVDWLVWMDGDSVICANCGVMFTPESAEE